MAKLLCWKLGTIISAIACFSAKVVKGIESVVAEAFTCCNPVFALALQYSCLNG
jgi:hypothetical protein